MTGIALLSVIALCSVSCTGTETNLRLTGYSIPDLYQIHLEPDFVNNTFKGNVTIEFHVTNKTSVILFHQKNLRIRSVTMKYLEVKEWNLFHNSETMTVSFYAILQLRNRYHMNIIYEGALDDIEYGFYRTSYTDGNRTKWVGTTQLQPTGARRVFPCWDEPKYKAAFEISITHLKNYTTVLSNMPMSSQTDNGETITTYFDRSIKMSTYLVAFVITDFTYKPHIDDRIKIYTKPGSVIYTDYAWSFTLRALKWLDEYTGIPYFKYMPKLDHAAFTTFDGDAMDNWGLMTYKEAMILYEEGVTTTAHKENISKTIVHELVHQWFGNLVSPVWWDCLWLNEGFAFYFEVYVVDKLEPTWRVMDMFAVEAMQQSSFVQDAIEEEHPMNKYVITESQIEAKFNFISYEKAGCVIRMFSQILTEEVLHAGLKTYLTKNVLNVTNTDDLLNDLEDAFGSERVFAGRSFREVADDWINKPGFPLVTVTKINPGHYMLSQKHLIDDETHHSDNKWWIPITYATNHTLNFTDITVTHWLTPHNLTISATDSDWIVVNKQQMGYYRVNYDEETWQNLSNVLKTDMHKIHPVNRAQMIDDIFTLANKNITKYETAMSLALYLTQEIDYVPWMTAFRHLETLRVRLFSGNRYQTFKHYMRFLMQGLTTNVTYVTSPNDDHPTKILKAHAMKYACSVDVKECVDSAIKYFEQWLNDPKHKINPDLEKTILCTGLKTASLKVWNQAKEILETAKFDPETTTEHPLEALGCSNNHLILQDFLVKATQVSSKIEFVRAAKSVISNTNVSGVDIVQDALDKYFEMNFAGRDHYLSQVTPTVPLIAAAIVNEQQSSRLKSFRHKVGADRKATQRLVDIANKNITWINTYADRINEWLVANKEIFDSSGTLEFTSFLLILSIFMTRYF